MNTTPTLAALANSKHPSSYIVEQAERKRKLKLLRIFSGISLGEQSIGLSLQLFIPLAQGHTLSSFDIPLNIALLGLYFISYRLSGFAKSFRPATWLLVWSATSVIALSYVKVGTAEPLFIFFLIPITAAAILMETWETVAVTTFVVIFTLALYLGQDVFGLYTPFAQTSRISQLTVTIVIIVLVIPLLAALLIIPFRSQTRVLLDQNKQLIEALAEIEQVLGLSVSLYNTANQQAQGSQEQVAVMTQINTSVTQLAATAAHIAGLTSQVDGAARSVAEASQHIEQTANQAAAQSEEGATSISFTTQMSGQVAEVYQQLVATLVELTAKSKRIGRVVDILEEIATDTHLLAVNATIEASEAGVYGERFGVIAREVRNLASQAAFSSEEARQIVTDVELTTTTATSVAEVGYLKAQEMAGIVKGAGEAISQMRRVAERSQEQAVVISEQAQQVEQLTATIAVATLQQRNASEQVLAALLGLSGVVREGADGSQLVLSTAKSLEQASHQLSRVLVT